MHKDTQDLVRRIGETDQLFLSDNTPELALERADLRLQLVTLSRVRQEQIHFLQEAIVLLEQGRISFDEMPMQLYLDLSLHLAKAYMIFFEIARDTKYAVITTQILKPLTVHNHSEVYFFLAYAAAVQKEYALTRHWLKKYDKTNQLDIELLKEHPAFDALREEIWFNQLIQTKLH